MTQVGVMYPDTSDVHFDQAHYRNKHMALIT
jgi:hypothetical protein